MQADISFEFAKVYNIEKADIVKGQQFSIDTDFTGKSKWFSDNDPVLSLNVTGNNAELVAKETGTSTILIMNEALETVKTLVINVVESIEPKATDLVVESGEPVEK